MKRIFQVILVLVISFGIYYAIDYYRTKQFVESLQETEWVRSDTLNKLSIIKYPEQATYLTFDKTEVQEAYQQLNTLELKKTDHPKTSENYTKIRFQEDGLQTAIEYSFYDNGHISRKEDSLAVITYLYYKVEPSELEAILEKLLIGKTLE